MAGPDYVLIGRIRPHPANVRKSLGDLDELTASIKVHGILQPIIVQPDPRLPGMFIVLAGHRRLAAAKQAGLDQVPVVIRDKAGPATAIQVGLVENLQRADLNPMERAEGLGKLRALGMTGRQIAAAIGQSQGSVSMYLSLLQLDEPARERLRKGEVNRADAVRAAREIRARSWPSGVGAAPAGDPRVACAALHFTRDHPLAPAARHLCDMSGHPLKRRIGKVACGSCWESVIRLDERGGPQVLPEPKPEPLAPHSPEWNERRAGYQKAYRDRGKLAAAANGHQGGGR